MKNLIKYQTVYYAVLILLISQQTYSQSAKNIVLNESFENQSLIDFVTLLQNKYEVDVYCKKEWLQPYYISQTLENIELEEALNIIFEDHDLTFEFFQDDAVAIYRKKRMKHNETDIESQLITIGNPMNIGRYGKAILKGKVLDGKTGENLIGAKIYCSKFEKGASTNGEGEFEIELPTGKQLLTFSYIGFEDNSINILLIEDGTQNFQIFEKTHSIGEIKIFGQESSSRAQMSLIKMTSSDIKLAPAFMGEVDIFKSITAQAGVQSVGELSSGINVRGGNTDQNLILINGSPVFNSTHLFGFFSLINPDVVEYVNLFKGGMPVKYGERVSSVMEIVFKEGNDKTIMAYGGIGLLTSRLTLDGPLTKNKKLTFNAGGRSSYTNWILKKLPELDLSRSVSLFYDISGKTTYKFNKYNQLSLTAYHSLDEFTTSKQSVTKYNNTLGNLSLKTRYTESLFAGIDISYSNYNYRFTDFADEKPIESYHLDNSIQYASMAYKINWQISPNHNSEAGFKIISNQIKPGEITPVEDISVIDTKTLHPQKTFELISFIGDKFNITEKLLVTAGLRYTHFKNIGTPLVYLYDQQKPKSIDNIIDSLQFSPNETAVSYTGFEPRISVFYELSPFTGLKMSYQKTRQNIFQLSNNAVISPAETWISANYHLPPLIADQFAIGVVNNSWLNGLEVLTELYYKNLQNLIEYKNGATLIMNEHIETDIIPTEGYSYGIELTLKKKTGRLTGLTSYVYSRTKQKNTSTFKNENLWEGKYYPSVYDRPHDFSLTGTYRISRRWRFSGNFIYMSGRPVSLPEQKYQYADEILVYFSERNKYRMPSYNRLDISLTFDENLRKKRMWKGSWTLSVYNVYGRKNAHSIFYKKAEIGKWANLNRYSLFKLSVIGIPIPTLTYNFKF